MIFAGCNKRNRTSYSNSFNQVEKEEEKDLLDIFYKVFVSGYQIIRKVVNWQKKPVDFLGRKIKKPYDQPIQTTIDINKAQKVMSEINRGYCPQFIAIQNTEKQNLENSQKVNIFIEDAYKRNHPSEPVLKKKIKIYKLSEEYWKEKQIERQEKNEESDRNYINAILREQHAIQVQRIKTLKNNEIKKKQTSIFAPILPIMADPNQKISNNSLEKELDKKKSQLASIDESKGEKIQSQSQISLNSLFTIEKSPTQNKNATKNNPFLKTPSKMPTLDDIILIPKAAKQDDFPAISNISSVQKGPFQNNNHNNSNQFSLIRSHSNNSNPSQLFHPNRSNTSQSNGSLNENYPGRISFNHQDSNVFESSNFNGSYSKNYFMMKQPQPKANQSLFIVQDNSTEKKNSRHLNSSRKRKEQRIS